jgi:DNA-binding NarL/FixJ family response regulator
MKVRIFLGDEQTLFRAGLKAILDAHNGAEVVGEADDGLSLLTMARQMMPDLVILGGRLGGMTMTEAADQLTHRPPPLRVMAVVAELQPGQAEELLGAGASAVLGRNCQSEELLHAIDTLLSGRTYLSSSAASAIADRCVRNTRRQQFPAVQMLTPRQCEVLHLLADGKSNKEMAVELGLSVKTVETHRAQLMDTLGIRSTAGLTKYAIREGLTSLET